MLVSPKKCSQPFNLSVCAMQNHATHYTLMFLFWYTLHWVVEDEPKAMPVITRETRCASLKQMTALTSPKC